MERKCVENCNSEELYVLTINYFEIMNNIFVKIMVYFFLLFCNYFRKFLHRCVPNDIESKKHVLSYLTLNNIFPVSFFLHFLILFRIA